METLWFIIVTFMLIMYVVLDGFDLGVGILQLLVAKTDNERRTMLTAIGPIWDGNEVWLLAGGGILYFAFPALYASAFSGLYIPLMIVIWLFIFRGAAIEFRHHISNQLWKQIWDVLFSFSSLLLVIFFGVALGNIIRGVPLKPDGYFSMPIYTSFTTAPEVGVLDWFTVLMGLVAVSTLTLHGANFIAVKTDGDLKARSLSIARKAWWVTTVLSAVAIFAVFKVNQRMLVNFSNYEWGLIFPICGIIGLFSMSFFRYKENDKLSFLSSAFFIVSMLSATAFGLFPNLLTATNNSTNSLTVYNTATSQYGLKVGLIWWFIGIILTLLYFIYLYRKFRGKVSVTTLLNNNVK